ncbi:MAG: ribonuclease HII [Desulfurococcaceae archaeon]|jgi:ribonuclease HII|nr:ribonuclease HII [Desulfurococcaceae archaeon]
MYVAGVDEAGRGPLIGDLFMVMLVVDEKQEKILKNLGVKDSKKLSRSRREKLFMYIVSIAEAIIVARITPQEIDEENLNYLELKTLCKILAKGFSITKIGKVYIDAFADPTKIFQFLSRCVKNIDIEKITATYGADNVYTVVGAASIVAKVLRDKHIDMLKQIYGDFGSGYPSDNNTIEWLKNYYERYRTLPPIVRKSWKTVENMLNKYRTLDKYIHKD